MLSFTAAIFTYSNVVSNINQLFYAYRIYVLSQSPWIPVIITLVRRSSQRISIVANSIVCV